MANTKPLIAFFGATGGSALSALVPALKAGYDCTALARTPSKLTAALLDRGVPEPALSTHLTITQGDVLNTSDCQKALTLNARTANIIISGIGVYSLSSVNTICTNAARNILSVLASLPLPASGKKPLFIALSTTGISNGPRDVPLLFVPFYHWLLANPHKDKRSMEKVIVEQTDRFVIMRASLLTDGKTCGGESVRVGVEEKPAVGYTISRGDVGLWVFENLVLGEGGKYVGQKVSVTY